MAYQRWWKTIRDQQGNAVNGASVAVYNGGTGTLATVYDPNTDDSAPGGLANPFVTGANGVFGFMAADGEYDVQISGGNGATQQYRVTLNAENMGTSSADSLRSDLAATTGAEMVGYLAPYTGAVARTQAQKNAETVSVADFTGYDPTGATSSSAAINAALAASTHVIVPAGHTPLIDSTIVIPTQTVLEFLGGHAANTTPASYFLKKSTMTTNGIEVSDYARVIGGGVYYQSGATGDGIALLGNSARLQNVTVAGAGKAITSGVGIRVGKDAAGGNSNAWSLDHCNVTEMSGHGFYIHDKPGLPPDANAGKATGCFSLNNGGDGFNCENANLNIFDGCLSEYNTGQGFNMGPATATATTPYCYGNIIQGGDYELNTAGQVLLNRGARNCCIQSGNVGLTVVDNGFNTQRLDVVQGKRQLFTPGLTGTTASAKNVTAYSISGTTATITSAAHGFSNSNSVWLRGFSGSGKENLNGVFEISNVTTDTFDVTVRDDVTFVQPSGSGSVSGPTATRCATCSVKLGTYRVEQDRIFWEATITTTDITNVTGTVQIVLPTTPATIGGGNIMGQSSLLHYSGITHTGKLSLLVAQDSQFAQKFYQNIGSGLAPGLLTNAGLAAGTTIYVSGWYYLL